MLVVELLGKYLPKKIEYYPTTTNTNTTTTNTKIKTKKWMEEIEDSDSWSIYLPNPSYTRSIFKQSLTGFSSGPVTILRLKNRVCPTMYP